MQEIDHHGKLQKKPQVQILRKFILGDPTAYLLKSKLSIHGASKTRQIFFDERKPLSMPCK